MRRMPRRPRTTIFPPMATTEGRPVTSTQHAGVTDARIAAAAICADLRAGALLDGSFDRRTAALEARDRRWTRELVYGMLRHRSWIEAMLESAGVETAEVPLVPDSVVLKGGVTSLTELGAFKQGFFHLQDPASTLVTRYACVATGSVVADLCAAPGGKALELARSAGTVIASDLSQERIKRVRENVRRLDATNLYAVVADATAPPLRDMDAVLIDVPCTGTGTFRRHPDARWRLKVSDLSVLPALQRSILREAASVVRPGGLLIYSTCSLETEENDEQIERFLTDHAGWTLEPPPDRKSTRLNSSHTVISYAVFCLKKKQ